MFFPLLLHFMLFTLLYVFCVLPLKVSQSTFESLGDTKYDTFSTEVSFFCPFCVDTIDSISYFLTQAVQQVQQVQLDELGFPLHLLETHQRLQLEQFVDCHLFSH